MVSENVNRCQPKASELISIGSRRWKSLDYRLKVMQKIENVMHKSIGLHCKRDAYTSECVLTDGGEKSERSSQSDW